MREKVLNLMRKNSYIIALVIGLLIFSGLFFSAYFIRLLILIFTSIVLAMTLNLMIGYIGIFTFGHLLFFGIGGYTISLLSKYVGLSVWIGWALSLVTAGLAAIGVGVLTLKFKEPYFVCLVTLGTQLVFTTAIVSSFPEELGGATGIAVPTIFSNIDYSSRLMILFYMGLAIFLVSFFILRKLIKSNFGLALRAIKESDDVAESIGIDSHKYKLLAFTITGAIAGFVGGYEAIFLGLTSPASFLSLSMLLELYLMMILGGTGTIEGPIIGAFFVVIIKEVFREFGYYRLIIFGIMVMLVIILIPEGIVRYSRSFIKKLKGT